MPCRPRDDERDYRRADATYRIGTTIDSWDGALQDLPGHAEAKRALDPGPHHPGIGQRTPAGRHSCDGNLDRPHDLFFDLGFALAAADESEERQHQKDPRPPRPGSW